MYTTIWLRKLNNKDVKEIELSKLITRDLLYKEFGV